MNPREQKLYDDARAELERLYRDAEDVRREFDDLISQMAEEIAMQES